MNIREFIYALKERPLMYVEKPRIDYVFYILSGYVGSRLINKSDTVEDRMFHDNFYKWVVKWAEENKNKKYDIQYSYYWYKILQDMSFNEQETLNLFFELVDNFFACTVSCN